MKRRVNKGEFSLAGMKMKIFLVEKDEEEAALCIQCLQPLHTSPFYVTEPAMFKVHAKCAEDLRFFLRHHQSSPSSSSSASAYKDVNFGFKYPSQQPRFNTDFFQFFNLAASRPYAHPNFYHSHPFNFPFQPPFYPPYNQCYGYWPPPNGNGYTGFPGSVNLQGNGGSEPTSWGTTMASALVNGAVSVFLQAIFGNISL